MHWVAAGVAKSATWAPWVEPPSPAASGQLRDEPQVGFSSVCGSWGSGPRWLRPSGASGRGPPAGRAPPSGRQPGAQYEVLSWPPLTSSIDLCEYIVLVIAAAIAVLSGPLQEIQ